jgi:uncharacterized protein with NAD-binding domain and iron-sulfur cluster
MFTTRRKFIAGVTSAFATAGLVAIPLSRNDLHMDQYPKVDANNMFLEPHGRSVCIIGAGLGGLQTAVELCDRGYKVTLLEKSGTAGGKAKSWRDQSFGPEDHALKQQPGYKGIPRDHGLHGIWGFYDNLHEFLGRHGWLLQEIPEEYSMMSFIDKNGTDRFIPKPTMPAPYNRVEQAIAYSDFAGPGQGGALLAEMLKLMSFDYQDPTQRAYMDSLTFEQYAEIRGMTPEVLGFFDGLMDMAYYANAKDSSALTMALICQLISGDASDSDVRTFQLPTNEKLFDPMIKYIESKGGEIIYNAEVERMEMEDGQMKSVTTMDLGAYGKRVRRCAICGHIIIGDEDYHHCPSCHADADQLMEMSIEEIKAKTYQADYFVNALDTIGTQVLLAKNMDLWGQDKYFLDIFKLTTTSLFVVNLWYNEDQFWKDRVSKIQSGSAQFFATGFDYLGITINWPLMGASKEDRFIKEYEGFDGFSILETHIPNAARISHLSDNEVADLVHKEYKMVFDDIPDYQDVYVNRWYNYTAYAPNTESFRPTVQSPIDNLLFVGDMVFTDHAGVYMEKTNVSSKTATNLILEKSGLDEVKLTVLNSGTPSALIKGLQAIVNVKDD